MEVHLKVEILVCNFKEVICICHSCKIFEVMKVELKEFLTVSKLAASKNLFNCFWLHIHVQYTVILLTSECLPNLF